MMLSLSINFLCVLFHMLQYEIKLCEKKEDKNKILLYIILREKEMSAIDFSQTSPFTTTVFKETINWKVLIKMLLSDNILNVYELKNNRGVVFAESERKQMEDILKMGMIVKKHLGKKIDKIYYTYIIITLKSI